MHFTDLGFLFLLLPPAAAVYYCFPQKQRPTVLTVISLVFFYLVSPQYIWLAAFVIPDWLFASHAERLPKQYLNPVCGLLTAKNILLMLIFGIVRPFLGFKSPYAAMALYLSSTELMIYRFRGDFHSCGFFEAAAASSFFARFFLGPVNCAQNVAAQLKSPRASVSQIARGIMQITTGVAKRVILAEQFFAFFKTISRMPQEQYCAALGWLCALCGAMGFYFTLSSFSDIAVGIGGVFSLNLPRMLYYPLQARSLREYIYRINFPLEDTVGRMFFSTVRREDSTAQGYIVSFVMPVVLALWISPGSTLLPWAFYLCAMVALDWLLLRHLPVLAAFWARAATFLLTLPAYLLLLPCGFGEKKAMLLSMFGIGHGIINDETLYLLSSNWLLLAVGILTCFSLFDMVSRGFERRFPQLWWPVSIAGHAALLTVAVSFLLWNVR